MALETGLLDVEGIEALIQIRKRFARATQKELIKAGKTSFYGGACRCIPKRCEGKNCELCPKQATCFRWKTQK